MRSPLAIIALLTFLSISHAFSEEIDIEVPGSGGRSAIVFVPSGAKGKLPVVLNFHGGGATARGQIVTSGMNEPAERLGFVVAYPEGTGVGSIGRTWNAGDCCGPAMKRGVDDVSFARALVREVSKRVRIDDRRIYAAGLSNGAQMAYRLACEASDLFAAVAGVASVGVLPNCRPSRPVPILHIHGTADPTALYEGGTCGGAYAELTARLLGRRSISRSGLWRCEPVEDFVKGWAERSGCTGKTRTFRSKGAAKCVTTTRCAAGSEVAFCTVEGGGHTWPGGTFGPLCERESSRACATLKSVLGPLSEDLLASEAILEFFGRHRR